MDTNTANTVQYRFAPPDGYSRLPVDTGSFGYWLRGLPLQTEGAPVRLFDGREKQRQDVHAAVLKIDVGTHDLQQCADAVIRLRAEYLYADGVYDRISFNFTSGDTASFRDWIDGMRPTVNGNHVTWCQSASVDSSYRTFRAYLATVFMYAGSYSLNKQLKVVTDPHDIVSGDVLIEGGFPGHAVIVIDAAENRITGERVFLLAQSYMPAQDIHILKNPRDSVLSPWYNCDFGEVLVTPEWTFTRDQLKRF
ncbi:MAG: DUF4846 domain-containing protein [candidate division Zixibacteria bacterium]|nr:DUF4846 domain-containing protein [candidate division Zixibacteria bacterium]